MKKFSDDTPSPKYRIKIVEKMDGTQHYYPQHRKFFFWKNMYYDNDSDEQYYLNIVLARDCIIRHAQKANKKDKISYEFFYY